MSGRKIVILFPGNEHFAGAFSRHERGKVEFLTFPDGESHFRIISKVKDRKLLFVCSMDQPNEKLIQVYLLSRLAKEQGAGQIELLCPYLAYMRQDRVFKPGEGVSAAHVAELLSGFVDKIITIDPHLHRIHRLSEIYRIPTETLHAKDLIAQWISGNITDPVIVGPDSESGQWVAAVAKKIDADFFVLKKTRHSDTSVSISAEPAGNSEKKTFVILDDIISSGHTMLESVKLLRARPHRRITCIAIHPLFAANAYQSLLSEDVSVVSCNTVSHCSNQIDVSPLFMDL